MISLRTGMHTEPVMVFFAAIGDVDRTIAGWERKVISVTNEYFYKPKSPEALKISTKRIERAYIQVTQEGTVPQWMIDALECAHAELNRQVGAAYESPSPP